MLTPYFSFEEPLWAARDGAALRLNRFERFLDQPVVARGAAGSPDEHRVVLTNVIRHNGRFNMWYTAMRPISRNPQKAASVTSHAIAYSDDGIHWEKPDLRLDGKKLRRCANNVLPDLSHNAYNLGVYLDGDRFVATHSFPQKDPDATTFSVVTSADGLHWKGSRKPAINAAHFEAACSLFKFKGRYFVLGQGLSPYYFLPDGRPCGRVMFAYSSRDLKTWKLHRRPAYAYPVPAHFPESAVQNHAGCSPVDRGRIALGFMGQFWPAGFSELVGSTFGLVYSYDGAQWAEPFTAEPMLLPDKKGWDCGMLLQGYGVYSRGDTTYYWYSGLDGGNLWWPRGSAGCVRIRRDGYTHFMATAEKAVIQTTPISLKRREQSIYLNAHATPGSPILVELLAGDGSRKVIAKAELTKSGVLEHVLSVPPDRTGEVCLRFTFSGKAKLYAFYTGPNVEAREYLSDWSAQ